MLQQVTHQNEVRSCGPVQRRVHCHLVHCLCILLLVSEELDVDTLKDILTDFAPRMGPKWDFIGIQLRQGDLVQHLRASPQLGRLKVQQIIDEWLGSEGKDVPACVATMSRVLRSKAVRLSAVAKDFERVRPNTSC